MRNYSVTAGVSAAFLFGCLQIISGGTAAAQTFISQGPGPRIGLTPYVQSADAPPNGTGAGAVQAILPDPALSANTIFIGSPNGGVWVSNNAGASWMPLTDNQSSLSIASLTLDPTDPTGKTIVAGIGLTSNGEWAQFNLGTQGIGGARTGLLYTTNGGATWSDIDSSLFANQSVTAADARGNTLLVATFEPQAPGGATAGYGLFRSTNGGATFSAVSNAPGTGLPTGAVTSLVADPSNPSTFYAAVHQAGAPGSTAVYISTNTGATWSPIFTSANSNGLISSGGDGTVISLAAGPSGSVAIAITDLATGGANKFLSGVFLSGNAGSTWNQLTTAPNVVPGGQAPVNLHIAIDPTKPNVVYLTGDAYQDCGATPCTVEAYRLTYNASTNTSSAISLTNEGTSPNFTDANTAHADSRAIAFDANGNLILGSDGGIYLRTNPQGAGTWSGLNTNLTVLEPYMVAYDANSNRLAVAAQDGGVSIQTARNNPVFNVIQSGDGTNVAINDRTLTGMSAIYSTDENFGNFSRIVVNAQGQPVGPYDPVNSANGTPIFCNGQSCDAFIAGSGPNQGTPFSAPFVLNKVNPTLIAIGGYSDVFTTQNSLSNVTTATSIDLTLTDLGTTGGPSVITYGTVNDIRAIAVGADGGQVWFSTTNTAGSLTQLTNYAGDTPTGIVFDTRIQNRLFVVDGSDLYYTKNAGGAATFATETGNLPAGFTRPTSLEFISNNGVNAVLIGGLNTPLTCTSAPNGCVIASTQSPITVADSDASGNLSGWRAFGQGLPNALVSTMSYDSTADVLAVGSVGRGVWVLYDVTSNFAQATVLQFGLANNDSNPDASLLTDGTVGSRPLIKYGTGTLTITGNATYTGSTTVNAGTLEVDGSIANTSSVTINSGGVLSGVGIVDSPTTTIMGGASLAPGNAANPTGIFTITGNLAFQPGAFYLVQVTQSAASSTVVSGTASLNGAVFATFSPNVVLQRQYTILQSAGLSGTTFSGLASQPTGFDASLAYTADNVLLNLTATLGSGAGLNTDQQNVANAINAAFNNGGALPANFGTVFGLTGSALTQALSQLDGEDATDASKGAFQFMSDFLNLMLDPSTGGSAIGAGGNALGFQPEQDATLPPEIVSAYNAMLTKAPPKPQSFDQRWTAWGSAFGGTSHLDGDPVVGTSTVNASDFGFAGGMDYRLSPSAILGFALAGGGTNWNLDQKSWKRPQRRFPGRRLRQGAQRSGVSLRSTVVRQSLVHDTTHLGARRSVAGEIHGAKRRRPA